MFKKMILIVMVFSFMGCSPWVKIRKVDSNIANKIIVYTDKKLLDQKNVKSIRVIEATSCKCLLWDPKASESNCIDQLKMVAYSIGANAIIIGELRKGDRPTDKNCWSTVECNAIAIIIKKDDKK